MKCLLKTIVILNLLTMLSGCGYFKTPPIVQGREKQYLAAHSIPPLRVPPGLSSSAFRNDYPIPGGDNDYAGRDKSVSTVPPGLKIS